MANLYTYQDSNVRRTWLLMLGFLAFVAAIGYLFSYVQNSPAIFYGAIIFALGMNIFGYWFSDSVALAMSRAQPLKREDNVRLFRIIENLSITAGLPMPRVYFIPSLQINAFATGRDAKHAAVAVTQGSLDKLDDNELEGVLAHELSHIGNRDILVNTVAVVLGGLIAIMSDWFLRITFWGGRGRDRDDRDGGAILMLIGLIAAIIAPLAATLIRLAISRRRESLADASGALLTRYPEGLARALEKIEADIVPMRSASNATAHLYIANPFKADVVQRRSSWLAQLFMTHPPLEQRIAALRGMEK